ncbi:MAG: FAD-binding oxidoreductase, partial [Myxococcota bacterium]
MSDHRVSPAPGHELSLWGWGRADRFPDDRARTALVRLASGLLGGHPFELIPEPEAEQLVLTAPRITPPAILAGLCSAAPGERASHTYGKAFPDLVRGLTGEFAPAPDAVARPSDEDEIRAVLDWCGQNRVACIPFGGGTSVVGGVEGAVGDDFRGVISLDMRAMDRVVEVDTLSRAARIQAGATGPAIAAQLAGSGLSLRHYPQSFEFSTLGGWLATRAGGHYATVYTHIDDLVESIRMVTPAGLYHTRRLPGSGAGPSPDRLALGSEGILGVITEAWVKLQPRPRWRSSVSVKFDEFAAAVRATRAIAQSGLHPVNCRLLDAREAMLHQVTGDGRCILLLGFESAACPVAEFLAQAAEIARAAGGVVGEPRHSESDPIAADRNRGDAGR